MGVVAAAAAEAGEEGGAEAWCARSSLLLRLRRSQVSESASQPTRWTGAGSS